MPPPLLVIRYKVIHCVDVFHFQEGALTTTNTIGMLLDKAQSGDSDAQVALAKVYVEARDFIQARCWFTKIAEKGDIKAMSTIASFLYYQDNCGADKEKDYHSAALMYHKAALLGKSTNTFLH